MTGTLTITTRLLTGELKNGLKKLANTAKDVGNSFKANLQSFAKMALILGTIVALIKIIRGAFDVLKERNDELFDKIELIKTALGNIANAIFTGVANILGPILNKLADWILTLLGYINSLVVAFGGMDLFSKRTAKNMKSTAKSAKEIKKQLAGFDEMNVLNSSSGSGGGSTGGTGGNFKAPEINTDIVKAVEKFKKMWAEILKIDQNEARKLLTESSKNWGIFKAGIFDTTQGIVKILNGLLTVDFKQVGEGIIQLVRGIVETSFGLVKGLFNSIKSILKSINSVVFEIITTPIKTAIETTKTMFNSLLTAAKKVFEGVKKLFTGDLKGALNSFKEAFKTILEGFKTALKTPLNIMIGWINKVINGLNKISIKIPDWVPEFGGKTWGFNIKQIPKLAQGGIVNNPGMGVNIGGAIAGERGAEAVIPLTDDTLQRLANMIPINVTVPVSMNGRIISRELQRVNAQSNFANNW